MSITGITSAILLFLGVFVEWIACIGLIRMRTPYDRLHATAPANILSPILIAAAVVVSAGLSQSGIKAILIALILVSTSPIITHATARAARNRRADKRRK